MTTEATDTGRKDSVADALAELIRVLAQGGTTADLAPVSRRVDVARGADRALLQRAAGHARQVASRLERRGRRMRELTALYETARDLTSLRDVDAVLTSIVERVRRLLGTDSTYIALVDDSGEIVMRVTSGTRTQAITAVRQSPGSGVGGLVIESGLPYASTNYHTDPRLNRDPAVARSVAGDGIVSIAGAPMKLRQRVVGALLAANRYERTFDQPEIAVLSSLAHHAAVVIENARLFDQVRQVAGQLSEVHAELSARRRELETTAAAHEALIPLALTQAGFDELAAVLGRLFGGEVSVDLTAGITGVEHAAEVADGNTTERKYVELRAGGQSYGRLVLDRAEPVTDAEVRVLESAAQTATLLALLGRQRSIVEQELRRELVEDMVAAGEPDWDRIRERSDRLGLLADAEPHAVVVLSSRTQLHRTLEAAAQLSVTRAGLAGECSGRVVLVLPTRRQAVGDLARDVAGELRGVLGAPVTAGAAGPVTPGNELRLLHREAVRCHDLLLSLRRDGDGAAIAEFGTLGAVLGATCPQRLERLVDHTLGPLLEYDANRSSSLLDTVRCYFAVGQSVLAAARKLGVHTNTLYQRLERVDRVIGSRAWRDPAGAVDMQVALQLYDAMAAVRG